MPSSLKMYAATTNDFSTGLLCAMKSRFYTTTSDDQLNCWAEKNLQSISQSQTCTKKTSWLLFGCLLPVWSSITFWIPAKPLHLRSMFSKFIRCTKTAMPAACIGQQKGPNSLRHRPTTCPTTKASKVEWFGLQSFASSRIFTWPLANQLPLLQASPQLFAGKMLPQPAGVRKCFPKVHQILKHEFLCYRNKQTYFSLAKMCWL